MPQHNEDLQYFCTQSNWNLNLQTYREKHHKQKTQVVLKAHFESLFSAGKNYQILFPTTDLRMWTEIIRKFNHGCCKVHDARCSICFSKWSKKSQRRRKKQNFIFTRGYFSIRLNVNLKSRFELILISIDQLNIAAKNIIVEHWHLHRANSKFWCTKI